MASAAQIADAPPPSKPASRIIIPTLMGGLAAAALSATATVDEKRLAMLVGQGIDADQAAWVLHIAPVALVLILGPIGWALSRGRSPGVRMGIYGFTGGLIGFITAFCLNVFAAFVPGVEQLTGRWRTFEDIDVLASALAVLCLILGLFMGVLATFGTPALKLMSTDTDPECTTVRPRDRGQFFWSAVGLLGQGICVGALLLLHLTTEPSVAVRTALLGLCAAGAALFTVSSIVLWRRFDELFRRIVMDSYAWSGIAATVGVLLWSALQAAAILPAASAYAITIILLTFQTVVSMFLSTKLATLGLR